ncbi:MAG: DUF6882 domain-containing protein, partial [Aeromicrobium sp.]
ALARRAEANAAADETWSIETSTEWHADLANGVLTFTFDDHRVVGDAQVIGSWGEMSRSWKWAWAQEIVPAAFVELAGTARTWAAAEGHDILTEEQVFATDTQADALACLVFAMGEGELLYRATGPQSHVYLSVTNLRREGL